VKQSDGTMKEIQEDEVLFEKIDEDPVIVATTSTTLSQAIAHNVTMLNEKLSQELSENIKLKDEIISLREEMNKWRMVENGMIPLKENILEEHENLHDAKVECFIEI
jgi:3-polyprenyl-4-hydroxybenzoate decarboxylase